MCLPIQKKVALALYVFNSSKTLGVNSGCGPSSKVIAIWFSLIVLLECSDLK